MESNHLTTMTQGIPVEVREYPDVAGAKAVVVRLILTILLLVIVWMNSHWSVALAITGLSVANEGHTFMIVDLINRLRIAKQLLDAFDTSRERFDSFVDQMNTQAAAFRAALNVCKECEVHGQHGIRPGSVHNRQADNCLMNSKNMQS